MEPVFVGGRKFKWGFHSEEECLKHVLLLLAHKLQLTVLVTVPPLLAVKLLHPLLLMNFVNVTPLEILLLMAALHVNVLMVIH